MSGTNPILSGGGFHHVALRVVDFDKAVAFYQALGFVPAVEWGQAPKRAVMMDTGDGNYLETFEGGLAETPSEGRIIHFALRTANCDRAQATALAAGAVETMAPKDVTIQSSRGPVPVRISFVRTPSGELVEFFQNELT